MAAASQHNDAFHNVLAWGDDEDRVMAILTQFYLYRASRAGGGESWTSALGAATS